MKNTEILLNYIMAKDHETYSFVKNNIGILVNAINQLDQFEKHIVLNRAKGKTLRELGDAKGYSREYIRQIEDKAIYKLKSACFGEKYREDYQNKLKSNELDENALKQMSAKDYLNYQKQKAQEMENYFKEFKVSWLQMSKRTTNALEKNNIKTVNELSKQSIADLLKKTGLGYKGVKEIEDKLSKELSFYTGK